MDLHGGHHWIMGEHFRLFTIEVDKLGHVAPTSGPLQITPLKIKE